MSDEVADGVDIERQPRPHELERAIGRLAARKDGLVTRRELRRLGLGRGAIDHRLRLRRLHPIHRGVYAVGHSHLSRRALLRAAALAHPSAVISHQTAAELWGLVQQTETPIHLTLPHRTRNRNGLTLHHARLQTDETASKHGIPVTTPFRTIFDLAASLPEQRLARLIHEADVQRRLFLGPSLTELLRRHPHHRGNRLLCSLVSNGDVPAHRTRSELEDRFAVFLDDRGLPRPVLNAGIRLDGLWLEVDALWPDARLIAELDGYAAHGTRRGFERDRLRDRRLLRAGYRVIRITWSQLETDPAELAADLGALIAKPVPSA